MENAIYEPQLTIEEVEYIQLYHDLVADLTW